MDESAVAPAAPTFQPPVSSSQNPKAKCHHPAIKQEPAITVTVPAMVEQTLADDKHEAFSSYLLDAHEAAKTGCSTICLVATAHARN